MPEDSGVFDAFCKFVDSLVSDSLQRIGPLTGEPAGPALLTRKQAADYLAVGVTTIWEMKQAGELHPVQIGGSPRYLKADLDKCIRRLQRETA